MSLIKVIFETNNPDAPYAYEGLYCNRVAHRFAQITHIPLYVTHVGYKDVISYHIDDEDDGKTKYSNLITSAQYQIHRVYTLGDVSYEDAFSFANALDQWAGCKFHPLIAPYFEPWSASMVLAGDEAGEHKQPRPLRAGLALHRSLEPERIGHVLMALIDRAKDLQIKIIAPTVADAAGLNFVAERDRMILKKAGMVLAAERTPRHENKIDG